MAMKCIETLEAELEVERQRSRELASEVTSLTSTIAALKERSLALQIELRRARVVVEALGGKGVELTAVLGRLDTLHGLTCEHTGIMRGMSDRLDALERNYDTTEGARREMDQQRTIEKQLQAIRAAGDTIRALRDGRDD